MAILRFSGRMLFILLAGIHIDQLDEVLVALLRGLLVAREEGIGALALPAPGMDAIAQAGGVWSASCLPVCT